MYDYWGRAFYYMLKEKALDQIKNTIQEEICVFVSKSRIKWRLHQSKYRGFTAWRKPLLSLKIRNNILWAELCEERMYA